MTLGMTHVSSVHQLGTPGYIDPLVSNSGQQEAATALSADEEAALEAVMAEAPSSDWVE